MKTDPKTGWIEFENDADCAELWYEFENQNLLTDAGAIEVRNIVAQLKLQDWAMRVLENPQSMNLVGFKTPEYAKHLRKQASR
jgi:precorrin-6x reductase